MEKAVVFTLSISFVIITIISFIIAYLLITQTHNQTVLNKIESDMLRYYVDSIDLDLPRALNIIGKRSLAVAAIHVAVNGTALDDAKRRVEELMINHTLYGEDAPLMENESLLEWARRVSNIGKSYGFNTSIDILSLSVKPFDSFNSIMLANISIFITNRDQSINISRNYSEKVLTSYLGIDDPLYNLMTNGLVTRKIMRYNKTIDSVADVDDAIDNKWYMNSSEGPSFFDRLEGRLRLSDRYKTMSDRQIALETFVDLQELSSKGITVKTNQSCVDYLYFNSSKINGKALSGSSHPWFKIDDYHASVYNVTSDLIG
ncbi:hypothetical protein DRN74_01325 [Candidatus Micrarchaeota archaeon]|nr:MAG: hypothetical protein DRN74_01325 [Candidatus Micrarchaeota archaeon]